MKARFKLGKLVSTPGALEHMTFEERLILLSRHVSGDWGDLDEEDKKENEYSVDKHLRILSAYTTEDGTRVWVITEADRSATTFLLPEEY